MKMHIVLSLFAFMLFKYTVNAEECNDLLNSIANIATTPNVGSTFPMVDTFPYIYITLILKFLEPMRDVGDLRVDVVNADKLMIYNEFRTNLVQTNSIIPVEGEGTYDYAKELMDTLSIMLFPKDPSEKYGFNSVKLCIPADVPADGPIAVPADGPIAVPADGPIAVPADGPIAVPADGPIAVPADGPTDPPTDVPIQDCYNIIDNTTYINNDQTLAKGFPIILSGYVDEFTFYVRFYKVIQRYIGLKLNLQNVKTIILRSSLGYEYSDKLTHEAVDGEADYASPNIPMDSLYGIVYPKDTSKPFGVLGAKVCGFPVCYNIIDNTTNITNDATDARGIPMILNGDHDEFVFMLGFDKVIQKINGLKLNLQNVKAIEVSSSLNGVKSDIFAQGAVDGEEDYAFPSSPMDFLMVIVLRNDITKPFGVLDAKVCGILEEATSTNTSVAPDTAGAYNCDTNNPCTSANIDAGKTHFPALDIHQYVKCSKCGRCYINTCPNNEIWNQQNLQCHVEFEDA